MPRTNFFLNLDVQFVKLLSNGLINDKKVQAPKIVVRALCPQHTMRSHFINKSLLWSSGANFELFKAISSIKMIVGLVIWNLYSRILQRKCVLLFGRV